MVAKVLTKMGTTVRARAMIYKEVVQTLFLYGSDIWMVTGEMVTVIGGLYHQVTKKIAVNTARRAGDGRWEWPPAEKALEESGLWTIKEYIQRRHVTIAELITNRPIYEL